MLALWLDLATAQGRSQDVPALQIGVLGYAKGGKAMNEHKQWDRAVVKMVRAYGDWQTAYDLTARLQREQAPGTYSAFHWNKMLDAFKRSRLVDSDH